jgi:hypothetical protein
MVRTISPIIEDIRGLRFKKNVRVRVTDDAAARRHFELRMEQFWPKQKIRWDSRAYAQLGLLPDGNSLDELMLSVLEEQAGGFYDPDSQALVILSDMPSAIAPMLLAHELTHALDDQHSNIDTMLARVRDDDDRVTAVSSVVEGSAMLVTSIFLLRELGSGRLTAQSLIEFQRSEAGQAERLKQAPPLLQRTLVAPYLVGQSFLLRGATSQPRGGFPIKDVNWAFEHPPSSTEQLLHPEKYWQADLRDVPGEVALIDPASMLGSGWRLVSSGTLGELVLAVMTGLGGVNPASQETTQLRFWTNAPSAGWRGDRYYFCVRENRAVTILATLWDSASDALEFAAAIEEIDAPPRTVARSGNAVVIVAGDAREDARRIANRAMVDLTKQAARRRK